MGGASEQESWHLIPGQVSGARCLTEVHPTEHRASCFTNLHVCRCASVPHPINTMSIEPIITFKAGTCDYEVILQSLSISI